VSGQIFSCVCTNGGSEKVWRRRKCGWPLL